MACVLGESTYSVAYKKETSRGICSCPFILVFRSTDPIQFDVFISHSSVGHCIIYESDIYYGIYYDIYYDILMFLSPALSLPSLISMPFSNNLAKSPYIIRHLIKAGR